MYPSKQTLEERLHELEEANRVLLRDNQSKDAFIGMLAHELRNPLAPIVSSLELLQLHIDSLDRPDLLKLIELSEVHTQIIIRLLDDLLDITRISRKKLQLRKEDIALHPIIERSIESVQALYTARAHTLLVSVPDKHILLHADPVRLEQILVNLLHNAAKYTEKGGKVLLSVDYDSQGNLRISIKDTGKGIAADMLTKIFETYIQIDDDPGPSAGLGIGLSLTYRLVELHGGEIWAQSDGPGQGSDFVVILPIPEHLRTTPSQVQNASSAQPAHYNKIGLLVLNSDHTKFLVCEKSLEFDTNEYIMPGGLFREHSIEECLRNEINEELDCEIDFSTLAFVGEYNDIAAGWSDRTVSIKLYTASLIGTPRPCSEIDKLHWIGRENVTSPRVSAIIRNKIIPDVVKKNILI